MFDQTINSGAILEQFFDHFRSRFQLTTREIEVLTVLSYFGPGNRELAERLEISEKTIKNHIGSILTKTCTHSTRELQALVFRDSFVPILLKVFKTTENNPEGRNEHVTLSDQQSCQFG